MMNKTALNAIALAAALAAATLAPLGAARASTPAASVAWQPAAADADIERAFAQARAEKKPVLLYWGAKWCPPCNQLKATLFNRQDFIAQSRAVVAVNVDGDLPGAQKLGARFKVRGYPTLILFSADGQELTRLPGEADAPQVMKVLQLGMAGGRPIKAVLADARGKKARLSANEWRLLSFYAWEVDEAQLVGAAERPALLAELAAASQDAEPDAATRLWLKALAVSDQGQGLKPDAALRDKVRKLLADAAQARVQADVLVNYAAEITRALAPEAGSADRQALVSGFETALKRLEADASLSRADRLGALQARVSLARLDQPKDTLKPSLPPALVKEVAEHAARADREIRDGYERQAVITAAAYTLGQSGLWGESDALLKSNLAKSHSPYYLMSMLGGNARKQGRKDEALRWYEEAFNKSEGPATRLQWGAGYFNALVELAPQDAARIEKAAAQLFSEAAKDEGAFYERSARSLQRVGSKLQSWNADGKQAAVIKRLRTQLDGVCAKVEAGSAERSTCEGLLKPAGGASSKT